MKLEKKMLAHIPRHSNLSVPASTSHTTAGNAPIPLFA